MSERLERITPEMNEQEALGLILDELMARAEPDVAEAIRFCAIPHWFNEEILACLRGEGREPSQRTREILAALTELTFVGPYRDRGYAYHENVRDLLLHRWRQENAERFQELSGVAAAYYADKLGIGKSWLGKVADKVRRALGWEKAPTEEQRAEWQREEMYHLLVADEERGLGQFQSMFSRARNFYQLSTCTSLLQLAAEQSDHLSRDSQLWVKHFNGELAYYSAQWTEAQRAFEELMKQELSPSLESLVTHLLGMVYWTKREWERAIEYYECSLVIKEKIGDELEIARTLNNLGLVHGDKGEWDRAIEYYERSLAIKEKVGDEHGMSTTFNNLGSVYQAKGEWDKAIEYYQRSLAIAKRRGDEYAMSRTLTNLGGVYNAKGEWDEAIERYQRSLEMARRIGDEYAMAVIFNNLGEVYRAKGEWDKAIEYYQRSLAIKEKVGDEHGMAPSFNNLGLVYRAKGEWDKAIEYYQRSLEIKEKVGDEHGMAPTFNNLGLVYQAKGEWDQAIDYYQRSLEIRRKLGDIHGVANSCYNIGMLYCEQGKHSAAIPLFEESLTILRKVGDEYHRQLVERALEEAKKVVG